MTKVKLSDEIVCMYFRNKLICNNIYSDEVLELATQLLNFDSIVTLENLIKHYEELVLAR